MFSFLRKKRGLKRDDIVARLADYVLKSGVTTKILESISPDERTRLGSPSRLEAQALNLWVVNDVLSRSAAGFSDAQVHSLIDGYHAPLRLARTISANLFKREASDLATGVAIAGRVAAALFAVNDLLRDALPCAEWQ